MQRYVNDVKADISREMELDELRKLKQQVEDGALVEQWRPANRSRPRAELRERRAASRASSTPLPAGRVRTPAEPLVREPPQRAAVRRSSTAPFRGDRHRASRPKCRRRRQRRLPAPGPLTSAHEHVSRGHLHLAPDRAARPAAARAHRGASCSCALLPWATDLYALLAHPLLAALPRGRQMIATDVIRPFLVPLKVTLMVGVPDRAAVSCSTRRGRSSRPGSTRTRRSWCCRWWSPSPCCSSSAWRSLLLRVSRRVQVRRRIAPEGVRMVTDIDKYLSISC